MTKHKCCPIMSRRGRTYGDLICYKNKCAFWNEQNNECCVKTLCCAGIGNPVDMIREQVTYVPTRSTTGVKPQDYYYNGERTEEVNLTDQYIFNGGL